MKGQDLEKLLVIPPSKKLFIFNLIFNLVI
jgi:hypothetical protein